VKIFFKTGNTIGLKRANLFFVGAIILALSFTSCNQSKEKGPESIKGHLDLTEWNIEKNPIYTLKGEWKFYWNQFPKDSVGNFDSMVLDNPEYVGISGKSSWRNLGYPAKGYGTYRLRIELPKNQKDEPLGLKTLRVKSACEIWANGHKLNTDGTIGTNASEASPSAKTILVTLPKTDIIDLIIPLSNYDYDFGGGIKTQIQLSYVKTLLDKTRRSIVRESAIAAIIIITGFFQLLIFLLKRKRIFLYLGLFCIGAVIRQLSVGEVIPYNFLPDLSFTIVQKSRYLGYYTVLIFMTLYLHELIPQFIKKWFVSVMLYPTIIGSIYVILTPVFWSTSIAMFFQLLGIFFALYVGYISIKLFQSKQRLHKWLLFS